MLALDPRPLTPAEVAVVSAAIRQAPCGDGFAADDLLLASDLRVVGKCNCGCASVFFSTDEWAETQHRVADGVGRSADGEEVGVIVWATSVGLAHLEVYNYSERPAPLPIPSSIGHASA